MTFFFLLFLYNFNGDRMKVFKSRKKKRRMKKIIILVIFMAFVGGLYLFSSIFQDPRFLELLLDSSVRNSNSKSIGPIYDYLLDYSIGRMPVSDEEYIGSLSSMEYVEDPDPLENKPNPLVYIYNTHQGEEYTGGVLGEHDVVPTVMLASYYLREKLNNLGVLSMVENTPINEILRVNGWNYNSSYMASRKLLESAYESWPTLNYFIDIHRDSNPYSTSYVDFNGKRYARILFVIGEGFKGYQANMDLAIRMSDMLNKNVSDISRGILRKSGKYVNGIYNEDFHHNVILIEVGSVYNNLEEISNTIDILAKVISELVKE